MITAAAPAAFVILGTGRCDFSNERLRKYRSVLNENENKKRDYGERLERRKRQHFQDHRGIEPLRA